MADTLHLLDLARLAAPFPPEAISWRVGATNSEKTKGLALAYIDARDVMNRLDQVCGPAGWQDEFSETPRGRVLCRIGIRTAEGWVWKGDGAGETDVESDKGAISDALKRAGVHWGIGRYLYEMPATWVEIETRGKTSVIKQSEHAKLARVAAKTIPTARTPTSPGAQSLVDGGEESVAVHPARRVNMVVNEATGRTIDTENARNQRPEWARFEDKVRGFIDARDADGLRLWFTSDATATFVAGWVFRDDANEFFGNALKEIDRREGAR